MEKKRTWTQFKDYCSKNEAYDKNCNDLFINLLVYKEKI